MTRDRKTAPVPSRQWVVFSRAWLIVIATLGPAVAEEAPAAVDTLFGSDVVLELTLRADFSALVRDWDEEASVYRPASLRVAGDSAPARNLSVSLKSRGDSRLDPDICRFVQLFVRFDDDTSDTPFFGQDVLPLTVHCRNDHVHEQYVLLEYIAYGTYYLLTDKGLRTRLAKIRYVDTSGRRDDAVRYAFVTEHFESLATRLRCKIIPKKKFDSRKADPYTAGLMDVFQYMIGNTDWSVTHQHNVVLLSCPPDSIIPLPYDFDSSGVVNARYATPAPQVKIKSVRERIYRGLCRPEAMFDTIFDHLIDTKPAIYALLENQPGLDRRWLYQTTRYYDQFYKTLANPKNLQKRILDACY